METTIANLLQAFEQGRMNRRQLIRSLAIVASGAHALRSVGSAQATIRETKAAPFHTVNLDHISYAVADYGRSRDFCADLMGWEAQSDNGENQATLSIGDVGEIIIRKNRRPMRQPSNEPGSSPLTGVINHIAWRIDDFDTDVVRGELEERGLNPRRDQGGPGPDYDSYHVLDPDGWDLQISK